jgi:hypothetical protein
VHTGLLIQLDGTIFIPVSIPPFYRGLVIGKPRNSKRANSSPFLEEEGNASESLHFHFKRGSGGFYVIDPRKMCLFENDR